MTAFKACVTYFALHALVLGLQHTAKLLCPNKFQLEQRSSLQMYRHLRKAGRKQMMNTVLLHWI